MCDAISAIQVGIGAISASGKRRAQKKQAAEQERLNEQFKAESLRNINIKQFEEDQDEMLRRQDIMAAARRDRSRMEVSAGESGLMGNTSERFMNASYVLEGKLLSNEETMAKRQDEQDERTRQSIINGTISANNQINRPSAMATGLQIFGSGLDAYSRYKYNKGE